MQSGRSVSDCTSLTAFASSSASSVNGTPMLTSSTMAPPATWAATSVSMADRSPARSCSWNALRPVGLMRSPMMQKGWSSPMMTCLLAERRTVCMVLLFLCCVPRVRSPNRSANLLARRVEGSGQGPLVLDEGELGVGVVVGRKGLALPTPPGTGGRVR